MGIAQPSSILLETPAAKQKMIPLGRNTQAAMLTNTAKRPSNCHTTPAVSAILLVVVALIGTLLTLPEDTVTEGALRVPAALLAAGLLGGVVVATLRSGFEAILRPEAT